MTAKARDWLPPGALKREAAQAKLQPVLEAWSAHWFTKRSFKPVRLAERGPLPEADGWVRSTAGAFAVRLPASGAQRLADAALDLAAGSELTDRDRQLLAKMAETLKEDLCARLAAHFPGEAGPDDGGWVEVSVAEGAGPDLFAVALPIPMLIRAQLKAMDPPRPVAMTQLRNVLAELPVTVEATLGKVEVSMPDLAALEPGDVLVLSTRVQDPLAVSLRGSSYVLAHARLADHEGELALAFQPTQ